MALSSFLANDTGTRPGYSNGYRIFNYESDPGTIRYKQFADEARSRGITDPNQIDRYALAHNQEWGGKNSIHAGGSWLEQHPWVAGALPAIAGGAAYGAGAAAAGGGAGSASANALDAELGASMGGTAATGVVPGAEGTIAGEAGGGGAGGMDATGALEGGGSGTDVGGETIRGGTGPGTAISRILDGSASTADWLSIGGNLASTGLGIYGSRRAADAYGNLNRQYMEMGAPSRARYEASMSPGFDPTTIPGYSGAVDTASKGILARLAATGGNPYGNPGGLIEANKQIISGTALPAIDAYQRLNAGTGGYASFNAAAPGMATNQIGAQGGVYNAVGSGLAGLLNPQPSLLDTLRGLGVSGLS